MNGIFWLILLLVIIIVACIFVYKTAEVHELYNIRAAFENKKHNIENIINNEKDNIDFNKSYYEGEIKELEELKVLIDKRIEELKFFSVIE